jgi:hypothetical protein
MDKDVEPGRAARRVELFAAYDQLTRLSKENLCREESQASLRSKKSHIVNGIT